MLIHVLNEIKRKKIILASNSPRRKEILGKILNFEIYPVQYDESFLLLCDPDDYVKQLSLNKAETAKNNIPNKYFDLLISADTVVSLEKEIIGKPKNNQDAINILNKLNNKEHAVYTGVTMIYKLQNGMYDTKTFSAMTKVKMANLNQELIRAYVKSGEPMDKAGAYGIQGLGCLLIEGIQGDFYNVMGFPLQMFSKELYCLYEKYWKS
ncbi:dTTP/UTP pyrophosphatase-like isoform X1 [Gordionus sp. m RMFG-2023]|uniref:dTTP/UTP pyrophosphatase-like isoform X1 n=1 Tax=Gordionus sp. m RMFG-2023 TaxID=3053472 RepID=UPI0031FE11FD